jgi:D-arabinose 1-dehydrogenase-like Zn-dependent alcohol dehydrogenase
VNKFKTGDLASGGCMVDSDGTCPACKDLKEILDGTAQLVVRGERYPEGLDKMAGI